MLYIRIIHSLIWLIMAVAVFYILYCGISGDITTLLFFAIGLLVLEIITLLINHWSCPFTIMAKRMKPNWQDGDDIFLPKWLAINNKMIFSVLLTIGLTLVIFRMTSGYSAKLW